MAAPIALPSRALGPLQSRKRARRAARLYRSDRIQDRARGSSGAPTQRTGKSRSAQVCQSRADAGGDRIAFTCARASAVRSTRARRR
jgi:hypothetical protein